VLNNITRHTNRRYECIASNGYPPDVARSFQFTIQYSPEIVLYLNNEIVSTTIYTENRNTEIHLKCQVAMNPSDTIVWMKDHRRLDTNYQIYRVENYIISELTIKLLTDDDQGEYSCMASNSLGMNLKAIQLFVRSTTTMAMSMTTKRTSLHRKRPKHYRLSTTIMIKDDIDSTERLRMITMISQGIVSV
jgi:hypothetical protein